MKNSIARSFQQGVAGVSKVKRLVIFALVFGLVKVNAVAAVFILSNLSPDIALFGSVDYALALGLILTVPLNAGLTGAYPYFVLKLHKKEYEGVFFFHGLLLCLTHLLLSSIPDVFGIPFSDKLQLTLTIAAVFSLQILAGVMYKSKEKVFTALLFEAGFFVLLNAYNLYIFSTGEQVALNEIRGLCSLYFIGLMVYYLCRFVAIRQFRWTRYGQVLQFGLPVIVGALLIIGLTGSARILIERWIGMEAVGIYGLYFRLAATVILIYQVINITFFKKLYTVDPHQLDQWFERFLWLIVGVGFLSCFLIPLLVMPYIDIIHATWSSHKSLYVVLVFQMIFWVVIALLENIIYREGLSGRCNVGLLFVFTGMVGFLFTVHLFDQMTLSLLVGVNALTLYLAGEWQLHLLRKKAFLFPKTNRLLRISFCLLSYYFIHQIIL